MSIDREELKAAARYALKWYCLFWGSLVAGIALVHSLIALLR